MEMSKILQGAGARISELRDNTIYSSQVFDDSLSKERTAFIELQIEYIHHDQLINPRGINSSISLLVKITIAIGRLFLNLV